MNPTQNRELLHEYQNGMVQWIKDKPSCALWVDMGLGKTVTTLTAIADLLDTCEVGRVLIIAPLRVALHIWPTELRRWEHTKHLSFNLITGTPSQRNIKLATKSAIHIINRELVAWLVNLLGDKWPYDMVVIDEASSFKSPKAQRFKALKKILSKIDRMVELTGTPASNGLMDVWSQVYLLDKGKRLGKTFSKFRDRYFIGDYMGYSFEPRPNTEETIYAKLQDVCLTLSAEDYLTMPKKINNIMPLSIPPKAVKQYKELEKEFLLELEQGMIEVSNAATLTNKLLQFSNGAVYTDDKRNFEIVHDAKIEALDEIIQEAVGQPVLVAYNYKSDLVRVLQKFPQAEHITNATDTLDRWNAGKVPILLAHPASAGYGLNLQHGGNIMVWFGLNWSLELYQQFNARLHRQGQTKPVFIHHLAVTDSIDMTILEVLQGKYITQKALLDALKKDINSHMLSA
ncbi:DEAD/DEAH box helicase [Candidatus Enterovibrio escicola]|uniref:DEAD/DEAH box helicase n=2 Tax=Candidatus Enterovibrio escicola TaxID=1927127 RepID=UPI001237F1CF|nr:DEAD/DEAH box helicase [Candidatus Enterovibrio escacola]